MLPLLCLFVHNSKQVHVHVPPVIISGLYMADYSLCVTGRSAPIKPPTVCFVCSWRLAAY